MSEIKNNSAREYAVPTQEVPEIFNLINNKASTQEILMQLYKDSSDPEIVYLGIKELISRGLEGVAALEFVAEKDKSYLGTVAKKIINKRDWSREDLEQAVEMKPRMNNVVDRLSFEDVMSFAPLFEYCKKKGYLPENIHNHFDLVINMQLAYSERRVHGKHSHTDSLLEDDVYNLCNTFGVEEPAYVELIGPEEILRLRTAVNPNFLLLGSLGKYSGLEFGGFTKKLNQNPRTTVVDLQPENLQKIKEAGGADLQLVNCDCLDMPFEDEEMDHVYTNYLFHHLTVENQINPNRSNLERLFKEVSRVLKIGGSFVISETPYGLKISDQDVEGVKNEIIGIGLRAGLVVADKNPEFCLRFAARQDVLNQREGKTGVEIDKNGFGQYGDKLLMKNNLINLRFIKSK